MKEKLLPGEKFRRTSEYELVKAVATGGKRKSTLEKEWLKDTKNMYYHPYLI